MSSDLPSIDTTHPRVGSLLTRLEGAMDDHLGIGATCIEGNVYTDTLVIIGFISRSMSLVRAICDLTRSWNIVGAISLLRLHIDSLARLSYLASSDRRTDLALQTLQGERWTDDRGRKLRDSQLVKIASRRYPWIDGVYERLCGFIHFSAVHPLAGVASVDDQERSVTWEIGPTSPHVREADIIKYLECTLTTTNEILHLLRAYAASKPSSGT